MPRRKEKRTHQDLSTIFDMIEYPDAFRITYLANAVVFPTYDTIKKDFGLIRAEYVLLACLSHYDVLTAQDVSRISGRPRNTVGRAVHRMLDEGYLARTPDAKDGRQATLRITPEGRALHEKIAAYLKERQENVLSALSAKERHTLSQLLKKAALDVASKDS